MKRVLFTAVAAAAVLAGSAAAAAPAFASTAPARPVVAFTFSPDHNDTTSAAGSATTDSPNGPVWAVDQLGETFTVKPVTGLADGANYRVTVNVVGSFKGFADPRLASEGSTNPGGPLASRGLVLGTITYDVSSPAAPDPHALPFREPANTGIGTALGQLFHSSDQIVGGGAYRFTYHNVAGAVYSQIG
jgi:hypothetical protein